MKSQQKINYYVAIWLNSVLWRHIPYLGFLNRIFNPAWLMQLSVKAYGY